MIHTGNTNACITYLLFNTGTVVNNFYVNLPSGQLEKSCGLPVGVRVPGTWFVVPLISSLKCLLSSLNSGVASSCLTEANTSTGVLHV